MPVERRFVVFGLGRSGSTLLSDLLGTQPAVRCDRELFNPDRWRSGPWRLLGPVVRRHPMQALWFRQCTVGWRPRVSGYGFMLKHGQLGRSDEGLRQLHDAGWSIIHLQRRSVFAATISALAAQRTGVFHRRTDDPEDVIGRLHIPPELFLRVYQSRQDRLRWCQELMATIPHLPLIYERDLQQPERWRQTVSQVCEFLGVAAPAGPIESALRKTWRQPYSDMIENHEELRELARRRSGTS